MIGLAVGLALAAIALVFIVAILRAASKPRPPYHMVLTPGYGWPGMLPEPTGYLDVTCYGAEGQQLYEMATGHFIQCWDWWDWEDVPPKGRS